MLKFQPKEGSVVYCDYSGFVAPEMVKKRPVIRLNLVKDKKSGLRHAPHVGDDFLKKVKDAVRKEHNL